MCPVYKLAPVLSLYDLQVKEVLAAASSFHANIVKNLSHKKVLF